MFRLFPLWEWCDLIYEKHNTTWLIDVKKQCLYVYSHSVSQHFALQRWYETTCTANISICVKNWEIKNPRNKWIDAAPEVLCFFSFVRTQEAVLLASNHGCVFPSVCMCVWSHCCRCSCSRFHLPPSPPFTGLINKTASAAPSDPLPGSLSSSDQILMCDTKLAH